MNPFLIALIVGGIFYTLTQKDTDVADAASAAQNDGNGGATTNALVTLANNMTGALQSAIAKIGGNGGSGGKSVGGSPGGASSPFGDSSSASGPPGGDEGTTEGADVDNTFGGTVDSSGDTDTGLFAGDPGESFVDDGGGDDDSGFEDDGSDD